MADNIGQYIELLDYVQKISNKYDLIAERSGEKFNIFQILGMTTKEVRTHSAFIAELLNPSGAHGMSNKYLIYFVNKIKESYQEDNKKALVFDTEKRVDVEVERWLGFKTETEGGSIDILLTDIDNRRIIIENKINAQDQENQLLRYHNFDCNAPLIYLTLDGHDPDEKSTNNDEGVLSNLVKFSYKENIRDWLIHCINETKDKTNLVKSLEQYLSIVKQLTHQSMDDKKRNELIEYIKKDKARVKNVEDLHYLWNDIKESIKQDLKEKIDIIAQSNKLNVKYNNELCKGDSEFYFFKPTWNFGIYFYFKSVNVLLYGVYKDPSNEIDFNITDEVLRDHFKNFNNIESQDPSWIWVTNLEEWESVRWSDVLLVIPTLIEEKMLKILNRIEEIERRI